ncbi:hypothetical protein XM47_06230 [Catenovulum maritimum]|uniref:Uncharacterized protein n=2 Tax=Catenovulum maritimum TaxID=1513271 RepID=A0A0J8JN64_9ALTE|nr:hypothetical protein XM47_06230 [Catenovulum maritimum]
MWDLGMKKIISKVCQLVILIGFVCSVNAKDLTSNEVELWLKAAPQVMSWLEQNKSKMASDDKLDFLKSSPQQVAEYATQMLQKHGLYKDFSQLLKQYGIQNQTRFFEIQTQIMQSFIALSAQQAMPQGINKEMMDALSQLENSDALTDEQKAQMKRQMMNMMGQAMQLEQQAKNSTQDMKVLQPYLIQIKQIFSALE